MIAGSRPSLNGGNFCAPPLAHDHRRERGSGDLDPGRRSATASRGVAGASCAVSGSVVAASGLPTDQVVNFMVNDSAGTWGWVLGYTTDGTWSVSVPAQNGPTTYQFVSRTWGPNGTHYTVFAACS
jgi:hypothetical protein